jgi:hypothetical protein
MNDPASVFLDGLSAAGTHWTLVLCILLVMLTSQALLASLLYRIFKERFTGEEYFSLSLAGWLLPACLISVLWYLVARIVSLSFSNIFVGILVLLGLVSFLRTRWIVKASRGVLWSLVLLAGLFILVRLAFVSRAVFPSYFDSAQHYLYIKEILTHVAPSGSGPAPLPGYYHFGFHFLAAFLTYITRAEITDTMLVLGQIILALMPFSAFFIVRHWTHSSLAGFLALTLAAFGWYMPAHAMDWGKYPALASLALVPFVLSVACLSIENRNILSRKKYTGLILLLLTGILLSVFLHSRSLVLFMLMAVTWLVTVLWKRLTKWPRLLVFIVFLLTLAGQVVYIQSKGLLGPLFDAYGPKGMLISTIVLVLTGFGYRKYPGFVFFCIVSMSFLLASLFLRLGSLIPGYVNTTPLDRPYVQMLLHSPLALLAGFGLSGLEQALNGRTFSLGNRQVAVGRLIGGLFIFVAAMHGLLRYDLYPSDCCLIVGPDDLTAIQWLDGNLPAGTSILTSSTDLNVLPTDQYQGSAGGDAGTWITPLTGRPVVLLPFNTDFSQGSTLETLCQQQVNFIYVGKTGWFFNDASISAQPGQYKLLLDLPKAKIFEVTGCKS